MNTTVKFAKVKEGAIIPSKRDEDAGFDIYACFDEDYMVLYPHETKLIPTGIASACSPEYALILRERGSTGSKGIALRAGVVDSGYRNEIFVGLTNTTSKVLFISKLSEEETFKDYDKDCDEYKYMRRVAPPRFVYPYSKAIAQILIVPVPHVAVEEISYDELKAIKSERGMNALGSSNK